MDLAGSVFRTVFDEPTPDGERGRRGDAAAAITTYRYLRVGMIVMVVALAASIFLVRRTTGCWQGSISAYYYTPARPIFVSGLIAISASLIIIKGSTIIEDTLLNFAGMVAPIVAFVPTSFEPPCVPGQPLGSGTSGLPDAIVRDAQNNLAAVLVAGAVGLLVATFVLYRDQRSERAPSKRDAFGRMLLLAVVAAALGISAWLLATDAILDYHGWAAVAMFALLALASIANGIWIVWAKRRGSLNPSRPWNVYAALYILVGVAMVAAGIVIEFVIPGPWDHRTLVLEVVEILLFASMWAVQSHERWGRILQRPESGGVPELAV